MAIQSTQDKFLHELGDIYDAEHRFLKGQQEMLQNAADPQLQQGIQLHIQQSQQHVQNLEQVFSLLGQPAKAETCDAAQGLVKEAKKTMGEAGNDALRDCVIDGAAAKVEHYEIASYRGLITGAQLMGQQQIVQLLQQNLQQEEQTAQKLEGMAPQLLQTAMQQEGMQPKGDVTVGSMASTGIADQDVVVNTSGASDILVDDTRR
jgi:ferritin-like metal-binding protein YciE